MIRVFLVDDHPVVRAGIRFLLEAKGPVQVVGEAESGEEALEKIPLLKPEVAVLDLSLPGMSGIETAKTLRTRAPEVRLVALSMHEDPEYVQSFFEAGGQGYVPKSAVEAELVDAVLAVVRGEYYAPARLLSRVAREMANPHAREAKLTERELEVVRQIAEGKTYKEIAEHLGISEKTVATYRERAAEKLGLKTRAELVRWALERGLLG
ncbi:response regulator [Marinithermus hydrothermalis]|uniref:Two component transcriptional regulator, LuxR family n=1 Tax=Marinithermus hydrothermalis (strain DSM 14884 / JCM 11576 / T1) TaxID=869210 RepID=F2NQ07_MARHT|nr:response regulator transcription factor [Marinithermus hydrothermalis]AEB11108.1 two component transcriptional regulator, LuxR family [Marinithermus hydrothermalis DSM 14884]